jgi:septum formation protein
MTIDRPVVLASASPRRRQLLAELVPHFGVRVADVDEESLTVPDPWETAERLARAKAEAVAKALPHALIVGGDTVVAYEGIEGWAQLAKPTDEADARRMLRALSGRSHVVITGVAVVRDGQTRSGVETTEIRFRDLSDVEIRQYVDTGEPMDKAGAYAIQGRAAGFVAERRGSLSNVVGLPLEFLAKLLAG